MKNNTGYQDSSCPGPLEGVRVLDCSQMLAGPYCGMRLGDLGADVLKIEPPQGEWVRNRGFGGFRAGGETLGFLALNRSKRSVAIDLKTAEGREVLYDLVRVSDVFIQNFRVGTAERIGIGYETLRAINPRLVYCSISGFGETGPYASRPSQDLIAQALSGSMWMAGARNGPPQISAFWPADAMTSLFATIGILAALHARGRTGGGQKVEANLLASALDAEAQELMAHMVLGSLPERSSSWSSAHALFDAPYGVIETADGHIALGTVPLPALGEALDVDALRGMNASTDGIERRDEAFDAINQATRKLSTDECLALFAKHNIWAGRVNTFEDVVKDEHIAATEMLTTVKHPEAGELPMVNVPIRLSETPAAIRRYPPRLDEHTDEVLRGLLDYTPENIERLRAIGAVGARS